MSMYIYLFVMFFRIGLFSFGGGLAMLPLIFQSVRDFGIMSAREFSDLVALSQVTPGPIAVNAATYVGFNYEGILGSLVATLGVCLPSFLIVIIVMKFIEKFNDSKGVQGAFVGIRPVSIGMIASAAVFVSESVLVNGSLISTKLFTGGLEYYNLIPIAIFAVSIVLVGVFKMKPIKVMLLMGVIGAFVCG